MDAASGGSTPGVRPSEPPAARYRTGSRSLRQGSTAAFSFSEGRERTDPLEGGGPPVSAIRGALSYAWPRRPSQGGHLTEATKSNGISTTRPYWDERVAAVAESSTTSWPGSSCDPSSALMLDLGGPATTEVCGQAIANAVR